MRALGENTCYQFFCRQEVFLHRLVLDFIDAQAPAHGRGQAAGVVAGEPFGRRQDRGDQTIRTVS